MTIDLQTRRCACGAFAIERARTRMLAAGSGRWIKAPADKSAIFFPAPVICEYCVWCVYVA
ncbi:hypothetical protein J2X90_004702 [Variovorax paradoxus]|uniref:hypothetical protein n=1 Tax=Variovorax paradoxus TaxID=34073 RepID=UPI002783AC0D|nr:hypothetical protein [Variovorax paradoxus]MDQ0026875.1 hypothetical protein [Variovorax paradoxus]